MRNKKTLYLLFAANSISGFAQGITMLAIPWYFASIVKNSSLFGTAYSAITIIGIGWILYAGTLIDRYSRKNIFLSLNIVGALVLGLIAASGYIFGQVPQALALLAFATTIFIYNLHYPTLYGLGQEITEKENYVKMNSQLEIQGQVTSMLSGGTAAVLLAGLSEGNTNFLGYEMYVPFSIKAWELHEIILLDSFTYIVAFLIISRLKYTPVVQRTIDTSHILQRLRTGLGFLKQRPYLFLFGICSLSIFVVSMVHTYYLLAVYISKHLQASAFTYAACELFYAFGAVMAGLSIRRIFHKMAASTAIATLIL
ncbi:MAG: MFS transporter, partial [Bacteroidia bacterium]